MYAELMNENVRIRAENVMLRKVVFALIAQADKDPFMSIGHFAEHGPASSALAEIRALNDEQERQMAQFIKEAEDAARYRWLRAELARELCPEVIAFAHLMQHKLNMNAHRDSSGKRGWKSCSPQFLMDKLYEEVLELTIAIHEGDSAKSIRQEAADVGNIAMMLADVCGALSQPAPAPEQLIELLSENLDTLSGEELLAECAEDFGSVDAMAKMFDAAVTKATAQASPTKSLNFIQGVLCSLSILDGYGDSIAYREVANPHDPNQLWEEADEFDREHLARHGYRPHPNTGER